MPKRYFDLSDDLHMPGRWYLGTTVDELGQEVDPWQFTEGRSVRVHERLKMPLRQRGIPLDFTLAGLDIPVVTSKVASLFLELASSDVQLIPVDVEGQNQEHFILNATRVMKCIDAHASEEVEYWMPEDGRPEKTGQYRNVAGMRLDPAKVGNNPGVPHLGLDHCPHRLRGHQEGLGARGRHWHEVQGGHRPLRPGESDFVVR